jgi:hypothetical protein
MRHGAYTGRWLHALAREFAVFQVHGRERVEIDFAALAGFDTQLLNVARNDRVFQQRVGALIHLALGQTIRREGCHIGVALIAV